MLRFQHLSPRLFAAAIVSYLLILSLDELPQAFLSYRFASWTDVLANTLGWAAALFCWILIRKMSQPSVAD